jgi:hypothetical protein
LHQRRYQLLTVLFALVALCSGCSSDVVATATTTTATTATATTATATTATISTRPVALSPASFVERWQDGPFADDQGAPIAESSPTVATLDGGGPAVVVGDRSGYLYAFHLADGSPVPGWPVNDGGVPIDSTPSVAPLGRTGLDTVFIGTGNARHANVGGYEAYNPNGSPLWSVHVQDPVLDRHPAYGVQASLTVTGLQRTTGVFAGSLAQESYALAATTGAPLTGWPFFSADSVFSTAAAADLYGTGQTELVVGGASTRGFALGQEYTSGGHLRILNSRGGLVCQHQMDQEVDSSPAVGGFLANGAAGIAVGTGSYYAKAADSDLLDAFDATCGLVWSDTLDGFTGSSPALADLLGNGSLEVVEGTDNGSTGSVWAVDGATGAAIWHVPVVGRVVGGVVTADLANSGYQDVLVPTTHGVEILNGQDGTEITVLGSMLGFQDSPLVTADPNGTVGITIAGYDGSNQGLVVHYEVENSNGAEAVGAGSWPMFHHDPQLTGTTSGLPATGSVPACDVPSSVYLGYYLAAADGQVFNFGEPACPPASGGQLPAPVVGIATAPDVGGYWLAAAEGAVVNFGAARFFGSMAGQHLDSPIVGIAATPDGGGYWLVAGDGGVFGFGDARYLGSMGGRRLNAPVVGIASSPDGRGYWLAAADGGVFRFGDARFHNSLVGSRLDAPVVGITADLATGGYRIFAADGGVFALQASFEGPEHERKLAEPIVGMAATADGRGYWLVAADGGVFAYGDAPYIGSLGGRTLSSPIAAAAGYCG